MRAVVVGAAGFIGSHLCRELVDGGAEVLGVDRHPLPESSPVHRVLRGEWGSPEVRAEISSDDHDQVFLLGGTASVARSIADPLHDLTANAADLIGFLEALRLSRSRASVVYASSAAVYGNPSQLPVTVSAATRPISPYGVSKLAGELYARIYSDLYGLRTSVVRPFSVYGPGLRRQVVWDVLVKLHQADPAPLFGTGDETRDFVHVSDACRALVAVAATGAGVYNVCTGEETSISSLTARLADLSGRPRLRFSGEGRPGDPDRWRGDPSELTALGWHPQMSLEEGLARTVDWFREVSG